MIKILIVDDSDTEIVILKTIFNSESDMEVVGCAKNGKLGVELVKKLNPDIVTMDIEMPVMDGLEATRMIMSQFPKPIVVISSRVRDSAPQLTYEALDAGALSVLDKPVGVNSPEFDKARARIVNTVRVMSEIKVVTRRFNTKKNSEKSSASLSESKKVALACLEKDNANYEIIGIGSSVGGPQALKAIFSKLPEDFPLPIVVVQHMTPGFIAGFTKWLNNHTPLQIKNPDQGEKLKAGTVYFAPDQMHFEVGRSSGSLIAKLVSGTPVAGFYPSVTVLLESIAKVCKQNAIGILLTGMGFDGAQGMLALKRSKAHTFIQDEKSAVVFGMAGVAQNLGAVDCIVQLDQISDYLMRVTAQPKVKV